MVRLDASGISFSYRRKKVLDNVSFEAQSGEVLGLVGPNGCGKTTLIKCIDGILHPKGSVRVDGEDIARLDRMDIARKMAYVPQSLPHTSLTVFETILMGRRPHLGWSVRDDDIESVQSAMELLRIEPFAFRKSNELSGGERQRVMIARAIAQGTPILLLDEPTSNLDVHHQMAVMEILRSLSDQESLTILVAIHDLNLAARYCHRLLVLKGGAHYCSGEPAQVLDPEMIRDVYGIEALVKHDLAFPYIVPVRSLDGALD